MALNFSYMISTDSSYICKQFGCSYAGFSGWWLSPEIIKLWDHKLMKPNLFELSTTKSSPGLGRVKSEILMPDHLSSRDNFIFVILSSSLNDRSFLLDVRSLAIYAQVWDDAIFLQKIKYLFHKFALSTFDGFINSLWQ